MRHLIVGIDPGKTTAIACLDLDGKLIMSVSREFSGIEWVISQISSVGVPSIIAIDKSNVNELVRRVNAAFNSRLFVPNEDIKGSRKRYLIKDKKLKNQHECDAYAAAIEAYNAFANKLKQVESKAKGKDADEIKDRVINRCSMHEAILGIQANRR